MNKVSLTVYGDDVTLASVREALPTEPVSDWHKGDVRSNGHVRLDSGFTVDIVEVDEPSALLEPIRSYLDECSARGITFAVPRIVAELRISFVTGTDAQAASLDFAEDELRMLADMGVGLSLTTHS